jgi:hypothetical protein
VLAEAELAHRMRLLHDIFGALAPHPAETLSVLAIGRLNQFIKRAKHILETNRAVLNDFYDTREDLQIERSSLGTTSFPRLMRGNVDALYDSLVTEYETAIVPGKFFESPQHFRIGLCADPAAFAGGVERLGRALDRLSS